MMSALQKAPANAVVILHPSAHNPTGMDPTREQWMEICKVMKERKLFPFFDCAYQGFATGDISADAWAVRHFASEGLELFVSQSFGKNMGLYGERIGFLTGVVNKAEVIPPLLSQMNLVVRPLYSNPSGQGAKIVSKILGDKSNFQTWLSELKQSVDRLKTMRERMRKTLETLVPGRDWSPITKQLGMFYFSDLTMQQGLKLMELHHVYVLPSSGRINIGAITEGNVDYVAKAIADVVKNW